MRNLAKFFRLLLAALVLCAGGQHALAQKVLMLTTNVTGANAENPDAIDAYTNMESEFAAVVGAANITRMSVLGDANTISSATFTAAPGPYDIAIVAGTYKAIDDSNWAVIQNAVANRWANSVVFFMDGCCEPLNTGNAAKMVSRLNAGTGSSFVLGVSPPESSTQFPLNTNSPFAPSFTGLNPFTGAVITYINNVPANNALYLAAGTPPSSFPPAGITPTNNVYGLLIPTVQSNAGQGACVFAVVDVSPFIDVAQYQSWTANRGKIGPAFVNAATSENGACGLPKVSKSFDKTNITLGGNDNSTVLTIDLSNGTPNAINNVNLTDNLPTPLLVGVGTVTNTCTGGTFSAAENAGTISGTGFTIPAGGCSITVPVVWPNSPDGRAACISNPSVTNTITPGTDFVSPIGQVNTPATATLACQAAQLTVSKQVVWPANVTPVDLTGTSFPVSVVCTGSDGVVSPAIDATVTLTTPNSGSVSMTPVISGGSCVASEGTRPAPPANHLWVEDPAPSVSVNMAAPPADNSAQLVNTLARANTDITISKSVAGGPAAGVSGAFNFTANCGADGSFNAVVTLNASNAGAIAIMNVPQGASCTVSEDPAMPAAPAGYAWSASLPAPVTLVTAATGNTASFVNTLLGTGPLQPAAVPGLKEWGVVALSLLLVMLGASQMRRRQR
ncbi:putative secreted protein (IPTL-CTERM system target) [Comamonas sp. JUb58]|nr:putative secreted protein (IPTL-CTERM system target) [Comamonas sp. JUb58]